MPNPKRRHSKARGRKRRTHQALVAPKLVACRQCHQNIKAHTVCTNCGSYGGRTVVSPEQEK